MKKSPLALMCLGFLAPALSAGEPVDYPRDVKPVLAKHCYACHGPENQKAGLRLDTAALALKGSAAGAVVVAGQGKDSKLIKAASGAKGVKPMPPRDPRLTAGQIALLKAWVDQGAKAPPGEVALPSVAAKSNHWAFQTPVRPPPPAVKTPLWVRNPIDRFILARLEKEGIKPSPEADRVTLIRRLSLDLLGLPPTPQEVDEFVRDSRADAYERLVDRLLASPHYGERWGRHWLDLGRYADSDGLAKD